MVYIVLFVLFMLVSILAYAVYKLHKQVEELKAIVKRSKDFSIRISKLEAKLKYPTRSSYHIRSSYDDYD